MLCEDCKANEAAVPFIQIVEGKKTVHHLCAACAEKRSSGAGGVTVTLSGFVAAEGDEGEVPVPDLACAFCGMTYAEFKKAGRFGCDGCYVAFRPQLDDMLKRIHGATRHTGTITPPVAAQDSPEDLDGLQEALRKAVADERFEDAARLRDRVAAVRARAGTGVSS